MKRPVLGALARRMAGLAVLALVIIGSPRDAAAAASDCIQDGGEMQCSQPKITSEDISICDEAGTFSWLGTIRGNCGWGSIAGEADIVPKVNCYEDAVTGCPGGTSTVWPGWSAPGQTYSSWLCWTITTRVDNGIELDNFASLTQTTTKKDINGQCTQSGQPFQINVVAWRRRTLGCDAGTTKASRPNGDTVCKSCPANATWNGTSCACNAGWVKDPSTKLCKSACPANATWSGSACVCDPGYHMENDLCVTCPANATWNGQSCACNDGYHLDNGVCVTCPANATWNGQSCACNDGYHLDNGACVTCPPSSTWNGQSCACNDGYHLDNGVCTACPANSTWNAGTCTCGPGLHIENGACVACPVGATWDGMTCACGSGSSLVNGVCVQDCTEQACGTKCSTASTSASHFLPQVDLNLTAKMCPSWLGDGSTGAILRIVDGGNSSSASCENGCEAEVATKRSVELSVLACSNRGLHLKSESNWISKTKLGKKCDTSSCSTHCDSSQRCESDSTDVGVGGGVVAEFTPGGKLVTKAPDSKTSTFLGGLVKCSGMANAIVGGKYTASKVRNTNYPGCVDCDSDKLSVTLEASAQVACKLDLHTAGSVVAGGYEATGKVEYNQDTGITHTTGSCGNELCGTSKLTGKFRWMIGTACVSLFGRGVRIQGGGEFIANCTGSNCPGVASGCTSPPTTPWTLAVTANCK